MNILHVVDGGPIQHDPDDTTHAGRNLCTPRHLLTSKFKPFNP